MMRNLIYGSMKKAQSNRDGWSFGLNIRFSTAKLPLFKLGILKPVIEIGITEARLDFRLRDAVMPDEDWAFDFDEVPNAQIDVQREVVLEEIKKTGVTQKNDVGGNNSAEISIPNGPNIGAKTSVGYGSQHEESDDSLVRQKTIDRFNFRRLAVLAAGGSNSPSWVVKSVLDKSVLLGAAIKTQYFARIESTGSSPYVSLQADISPHAIMVRDKTGAFESVNKRLIAQHRIRKEFCREPLIIEEKEIPVTVDNDS